MFGSRLPGEFLRLQDSWMFLVLGLLCFWVQGLCGQSFWAFGFRVDSGAWGLGFSGAGALGSVPGRCFAIARCQTPGSCSHSPPRGGWLSVSGVPLLDFWIEGF